MKTGRNSPRVFELSRLAQEGAQPVRLLHRPDEQHPRHHEDEGGGPVLHDPQQVHPPVDDVDVQAPEEQEREPLRRGVAPEARAQELRPARDDAREEDVQRLSPDPGLDAEPAARHHRAHDRGEVGADRAVGGAGEDGEGDPVPGAGVGVQQDGDEHDRVAEEDRDEGLPPVHPARHEAGGQHVGGDAVGHADPERGVVVRRPAPAGHREGGEVFVVERALLDARGVLELDAAVRVDLLVRPAHGTRGRPACRFTNCPRPALALNVPWSTITSPRDKTTAGAPFTTRPS